MSRRIQLELHIKKFKPLLWLIKSTQAIFLLGDASRASGPPAGVPWAPRALGKAWIQLRPAVDGCRYTGNNILQPGQVKMKACPKSSPSPLFFHRQGRVHHLAYLPLLACVATTPPPAGIVLQVRYCAFGRTDFCYGIS